MRKEAHMVYSGIRVVPTAGQGAALAEAVKPYLKIVEKHGGKPVGAWRVAIGQGWGDYLYVHSYDDMAALGKATEATVADPEFQQLMSRIGSQIASVTTSVLQPLPESSLQ
jgi:hypothetical protein